MKASFYLSLSLLICFMGLFVVANMTTLTYKVKVFYADTRPPKVITLEFNRYGNHPPDKAHIHTHKEAVPKFYGELNVIDIEIISCDTLIYHF